MDGVINVLKPPGMTSSDVVVFLRKLLKVRKAGHTGTLDPGAAGVLPVCIGKATKLTEFIMAEKKTYLCEIVLGIETDTLDAYGKVTFISDQVPGLDRIKSVFSEFKGEIQQIPPMYSAIKHKGKKLYEFARRGQKIPLPPKSVTIFRNDILNFYPPNRVLFEVECSKGTYIRALCRDIGKRLKCGAYMSFLLRCQSGIFKLSDSYTLNEIKDYLCRGFLNRILVPMDEALPQLKKVIVSPKVYERIIHGNTTANNVIISDVSDISLNEYVKIYCKSKFIGIGYLAEDKGRRILKIKKVLI